MCVRLQVLANNLLQMVALLVKSTSSVPHRRTAQRFGLEREEYKRLNQSIKDIVNVLVGRRTVEIKFKDGSTWILTTKHAFTEESYTEAIETKKREMDV